MKPVFIICCSILLAISSCTKTGTGNNNSSQQPPSKVVYQWSQFVMGADLSYVNEVQDNGSIYKDSGAAKDPYLIFKNHGANTVRVRLWNNPQWTGTFNNGKLYSDLKDAEPTMQNAKSNGMAVCLDLHYSDEWADPGHQKTPAAWNGVSLSIMKDSVYNYTLAVLSYFKSKNLTPEMIQVGNEINGGMLFDAGKIVNDNWTAFGELLKSGIKAVRDFSATSSIKPQIILHVAQPENADWWTNGIINKAGVTDFDIVGISFYYVYSTFNNIADIGDAVKNIKTKYSKKVMIVETAYPWTNGFNDNYNNLIPGTTTFSGYPVSKEGQSQYMKDLTQQVISNGGSGVIYWEPAWVTSSMHDQYGTGSAWENCAYFDFSGNTLPVMDFMTYPYKF